VLFLVLGFANLFFGTATEKLTTMVSFRILSTSMLTLWFFFLPDISIVWTANHEKPIFIISCGSVQYICVRVWITSLSVARLCVLSVSLRMQVQAALASGYIELIDSFMSITAGLVMYVSSRALL